MMKIMFEDLDEIFGKYDKAIEFLNYKINCFKFKLAKNGQDYLINDFTGRRKEFTSLKNKILKKFGDKKEEFTVEDMEREIRDIAGIRIICLLKQDLPTIINFINEDEDIEVLNVKDFITNPKPSGYSSYHMIVSVPVLDDKSNQMIRVNAEIQIRTLAMDLWASLDHKTVYKSKVTDALSFVSANDIGVAARLVGYVDAEYDALASETSREERLICSKKISIDNDILEVDDKGNKRIKQSIMSPYYNCMDELQFFINNLQEYIKYSYDDNLIDRIKCRIKSDASIADKLNSRGLNVSDANLNECISDVVGFRIICPFICDALEVIDLMLNDEYVKILRDTSGIKILETKDYITNPKENGYSSYHIIVSIPIWDNGMVRDIKAEIQIRTKAMNLWSSFEHYLCYKRNVPDEIMEQLYNLAEKITLVDKLYDHLIKEQRAEIQLSKGDDNNKNSLSRKKK